MPRLLLGLASFVLASSVASAQNFSTALPIDQAREHLVDRAIPPETLADAIVDFVPDVDMRLDVASAVERTIPGRIMKNERGPEQLRAIVHTANTMIRPIEAGKPVKVFLKQFAERNEYYVIAILPITYTYEGQR